MRYVRANLVPPDRSVAIQAPVVVLILALPFLLRVRRGQGPAVLVAGLLLQLGLYAFYESGISGYTNIRIDLLLVYPAIIWSVVLAGRAMSRRRIKNSAPA